MVESNTSVVLPKNVTCNNFHFFVIDETGLLSPSKNHLDHTIASILDTPSEVVTAIFTYFGDTLVYWIPLMATIIILVLICCRIYLTDVYFIPTFCLFFVFVVFSYMFAFDSVAALDSLICESSFALHNLLHTIDMIVSSLQNCISSSVNLLEYEDLVETFSTFRVNLLFSVALATFHIIVLFTVPFAHYSCSVLKVINKILFVLVWFIASVAFAGSFAASQVNILVDGFLGNESLILTPQRCVQNVSTSTLFPCNVLSTCIKDATTLPLVTLLGHDSMTDLLRNDALTGDIVVNASDDQLQFVADLITDSTALNLAIDLDDERTRVLSSDVVYVFDTFTSNLENITEYATPLSSWINNTRSGLLEQSSVNRSEIEDIFVIHRPEDLRNITLKDLFPFISLNFLSDGRRLSETSCTTTSILDAQNMFTCSTVQNVYYSSRTYQLQNSLFLFSIFSMILVVLGYVLSIMNQKSVSHPQEEKVKPQRGWLANIDPLSV